MNRLSVRSVSVPQYFADREESIEFLDWEIDGVSLREAFNADAVMTLLQDDEWLNPVRVESIARLTGQLVDPPTFVPTFHRTRLDKFLGRRGTPYARFGAAFDDARVGLLFCMCGDIDCPTVSTQVIVADDVVTWRDIDWQVSYEPFGSTPFPALNYGDATFDRAEYDSLMTSLLRP